MDFRAFATTFPPPGNIAIEEIGPADTSDKVTPPAVMGAGPSRADLPMSSGTKLDPLWIVEDRIANLAEHVHASEMVDKTDLFPDARPTVP